MSFPWQDDKIVLGGMDDRLRRGGAFYLATFSKKTPGITERQNPTLSRTARQAWGTPDVV